MISVLPLSHQKAIEFLVFKQMAMKILQLWCERNRLDEAAHWRSHRGGTCPPQEPR